jgi:hypothetical protein
MRKSIVCKLERVKGIEPSSSAWKAEVLPLNYTRDVVPVAGIEPALQRNTILSRARLPIPPHRHFIWRRQPDLNR